jgi:hypothetical protein
MGKQLEDFFSAYFILFRGEAFEVEWLPSKNNKEQKIFFEISSKSLSAGAPMRVQGPKASRKMIPRHPAENV